MDRTITTMVKGGLGNQMFCYAAARALALRTGRTLWLDTVSGFRRDGYGRAVQLGRFPVTAGLAPAQLRLGDDPRHQQHRLARALARLLPRDWCRYLAEDPAAGPAQLTALAPRRRHLYLNGYWQDERYFANHAATIRRELSPPAPADAENREIARTIDAAESVALHVRRLSYSPRLDAGYYDAAIRLVRERIPAARFFVFGDDPDWGAGLETLDPSTTTVVRHNPTDEVADLFLMTRCRHAIVANSSFSWWGAWLAAHPHPGQLIIAPARSGWPLGPAAGWATLENDLDRNPAQRQGPTSGRSARMKSE